jgi:hypothetical protein
MMLFLIRPVICGRIFFVEESTIGTSSYLPVEPLSQLLGIDVDRYNGGQGRYRDILQHRTGICSEAPPVVLIDGCAKRSEGSPEPFKGIVLTRVGYTEPVVCTSFEAPSEANL